MLWTDLDDAAVRRQVRGQAWTTVDVLDLATDQTAGFGTSLIGFKAS
jgi:hypothetical protein